MPVSDEPPSPSDVPNDADVTISAAQLRMVQDRLQRFMLEYEFGLREIETKIYILRDEFQHMHDYNPIEHVSTRVKSADSILRKVARKGVAPPGAMPDLPTVREHILDIAGVRVTCSFVRDAYRLFDLLTRQDDIRIREVKDYIAEPKANGYKSLHAIVDVPVFLSTGTLAIPVEVQFRTIAMDFWASLEHKIFYKYEREVPGGLLDELRAAADTATMLDERMQRLHREVASLDAANAP
jgi:GTP pyrophosphokinase